PLDTAGRLVNVAMRNTSPMTTAHRRAVRGVPEKQYRPGRLWHTPSTSPSPTSAPSARVAKCPDSRTHQFIVKSSLLSQETDPMLWLKAFHLIFVVCWFAGIFY